MPNSPSPFNAPRWFDPRQQQAGSWAFIFNRLSGLGLTFYLGIHLGVLHKLTQGAQAYDDYVAFAQSAWIKLGEVILIAAVVFHGLNGLRLTLHSLNSGVRQQKKLMLIAVIITILISAIFGIRVFSVQP